MWRFCFKKNDSKRFISDQNGCRLISCQSMNQFNESSVAINQTSNVSLIKSPLETSKHFKPSQKPSSHSLLVFNFSFIEIYFIFCCFESNNLENNLQVNLENLLQDKSAKISFNSIFHVQQQKTFPRIIRYLIDVFIYSSVLILCWTEKLRWCNSVFLSSNFLLSVVFISAARKHHYYFIFTELALTSF